MPHFVYIIRCADGSLYTGMTGNLSNRFAQHSNGQGAQWTRQHGVEALVYAQKCKDRPSALKFEARIKRLPRTEKLRLIASRFNLVIASKTR